VEIFLDRILEFITAGGTTLIAALAFWIAKRVGSMMKVIGEVERFMADDRHNHRINEADHDLLFKILEVPAHKITTARRAAGLKPPHAGL